MYIDMKKTIKEYLVSLLILGVLSVGAGLVMRATGFKPDNIVQCIILGIVLVAIVKVANWITKILFRKNQESKEIKKCQE
jgi:cation transporter-like permease